MKKREPYSLSMHLARFGTEQACHDYLIQSIWKGKPTCPRCGNNHMNYFLSTRRTYKCSECSKQFKATTGTIFERSKLPLTKWFFAIYIFTTMKRGVSSCQMAKLLGIQQRTAWFLLQRLRTALENENDLLLSGTVEGDETSVMPKVSRDKRLQAAKYIHEKEQDRIHGLSRQRRLKAGIKLKRGRKKGSTKEVLMQKAASRGSEQYNSHPTSREPFEKGAVILGFVERGGRVVMKKLGRDARCVTKDAINVYLKKHVAKGSIFVSDQSPVYNDAATLFPKHLTVNHEIGYVIDDVHNNNIENAWNHFKRMIRGSYFHMSYHHFDGYLHENSFRWNRRLESIQHHIDSFIHLTGKKAITYRKLTTANRMAA